MTDSPWCADFLKWSKSVPMQSIELPEFDRAGLNVIVRRDDLLHPAISGNKAYKLLGHLETAHRLGARLLVSFGGAYSNHLHALAAASACYGFSSLAIIRGERPKQLSPTLRDVEALGMQLRFVSRADYASSNVDSLLVRLREEFGGFYLIPEGGGGAAGTLGLKLCMEAIAHTVDSAPDAICVAAGTGTTLAGLARYAQGDKFCKAAVMGFSVLKGEGNLGATIRKLTPTSLPLNETFHCSVTDQFYTAQWRLIHGFHAGGYAKTPKGEVLDFWRRFESSTGIPLDPVYTLKMFWGMASLANQGYWQKGSTLVAIHSGGLQGRRGFACPEI